MTNRVGQPPRTPATDSLVEPSDSDGSEAYLSALQSEESKDEESEDEEAEDQGTDDDSSPKSKREKRRKLEKFGSTSKHQESLFPENLELKAGKTSEEEFSSPFQCIPKVPSIQKDEFASLPNEETKKLLDDRKLYLVLDLDYTLLNSTLLTELAPEEEYLKSQIDSLQDVSEASLFVLDSMTMMTKLRPHVHKFLKEASHMYKMYVYTLGRKTYASEMVKLIDPHGEYFRNRVISQDNTTQKHWKNLDFLPGQESAILILDDSEDVWLEHKDNLIVMERYLFFASNCCRCGYKYKSLSELNDDECELDGALASILNVLEQIHKMFFCEPKIDHASRDVRQLLKKFNKQVLKGCKIVFSRVFPNNSLGNGHQLWKMAEQLGATCLSKLDSSVTHVVSTDCTTAKSAWALRENKFLVNPRWIKDAKSLWRRQPEKNFPVEVLKGCKIFFSSVFPSDFLADGYHELLGATHSTELDPSVTHVISADCRTEESVWALREKKFSVNLRWIKDARSLWKRQPENKFPVDVLKGCKIIFSGFIPTKSETDGIQDMAEKFGATCLTICDPSVTHVVSTNPRTEESGWAVREKKFLVNPGWIKNTKSLWHRQPERNFPLEVLKGCKFLFSGFSPTCSETDSLRDMAEILGATCLTIRDPSVTHVVSTDCRTEESDWAQKEKKFLVNPQWILDTKSFWKKKPEKKYPVEVLKGCKIVFSGIVPTNFEIHSLRKMAEQLGATCFTDLDSSLTHVVSENPKTASSLWARKEKKFLVHPRWIEDAKSSWTKQPEKKYPVEHAKHDG